MLPIDLPAPPETVIVVTGRALPEPRADRLLDVVVITKDALRLAPTRRLDQLLKQASGVQLFRRSDSSSAQPTSQGITLRGLGGNAASRALVILDGVPQTDPFGGWINWPAFSTGGLAEVRVVRGGGSVGFGPGALAGAIDLTSADYLGLAAEVEGGSRGSAEARLNAGMRAGTGQVNLSIQAARGDGFNPIVRDQRGPVDRASPYRNASGRFRWVTPLDGSTELQANLAAFIDERERGLAFTDNRTRGVDGSLRLVGRGALPWVVLGYGQLRRFESGFASIDPARTTARRASLQDHVPGRAIGWSGELRPRLGSDLELRLGTDARFARGRSEELANYVSGSPTRRRISGGRTANAGVFGELGGSAGPLQLSGALRIDRWRISDGSRFERLLSTSAVLVDERFAPRTGWLPTARVAAGLDIGGGFAVRAAAYTGWRLPTLNELFRPFRAGSDATAANPELEPERLVGAETGLKWQQGPASFSVTAFVNRLQDPIANVTLGTGPGLFPGVGFVPSGGAFRKRLNLEAIVVRGVEASANWSRGPWSASLSSSFVDPRVVDSGPSATLDGLRPAQTPRFNAAVAGRWEQDGKAGSLVLRHVGSAFENDLNTARLPAALTLDGFAALPISQRVRLQFRAENLFDKRVTAGIGGNGVIERATPRTLWLGISLLRVEPGDTAR